MIDIDRLRSCLDDAEAAEPWLRSLCVANLPAAHANFTRMADHGVTLDLLTQISEQFAAAAPTLADPDMAINNLERFIAASRNPMATAALFERDPDALPNLLQIFSTSQYLSDLLVADKEAYDLLADDRRPAGRPAGAGRRIGQRSSRAGQLRRSAGVAAAVQAPRNAANRLRRHRPQSAGRNGRAANFVPGRCDRRSGARFRPAASATSNTASRCAPTASGAGSSCSASASWAASS